MKNLIKTNNKSCVAFVTTLFAVIFMLGFDSYSLSQITPETPLLKIAGLPFLRMDFILIIFSIAFLVGTLFASLLKKASNILISISTAMLGVITLIISILNVDLMQKLFPTMRISHVIMTLSLVLSIAFSVSGLFVGINMKILSKFVAPTKAVFSAVLIGTLLSVLAEAENLQQSLYFVLALALFGTSFLVDFFSDTDRIDINGNRLSILATFVSFFSLATIFGTLFTVLCNSDGFSTIGYMVVAGLLLACATPIIGTSFSALWVALGLVGGSFASYVIIHYAGDTITYSGNRVIYILSMRIFIIYAILIASSVILYAINKQKHTK